ncbi:uncharacterized protein BHQ10_007428 [Talaromyces amestolkiae]|uniref:Transcription factor domain-containing protein n=1 Tax=Talaromyces amestolkiae TaxID=1196081 RepID=A0A364L6J4_TALAM|nr:uncharacterized protein BHQ10_007428 [Talaromyces amestolkiae]RAO71416.1 hypothetical protein BHQ10_007428 [Talaromyces amestolkiae]
MPQTQKTKPIRFVNTHPVSKSRKKYSRLIVGQQIKERPDSETRQRVSTQSFSVPQNEVDNDEENNAAFVDDEDFFGQEPTVSRSPFRPTSSQSTSIVNLGAGNIDPFRTYPSKVPSATVNKCLSYSLSLILPNITPRDAQGKSLAASHWYSLSFQDPVCLSAFLFGSSLHKRVRYLSSGKTIDLPNNYEEREMRALELQLIQGVNKAITDSSRATSDAVIMAIMTLAHGSSDDPRWYVEQTSPFQAPLKSLQWLDAYAFFEMNLIHNAGLLRIISLRGGLTNIKYPGLAPVLSLSGIIYASKTLTRPVMPFIRMHDGFYAEQEDQDLETIENRFNDLLGISLPLDLCKVFQRMQNYLHLLEQYTEGTLPQVDLCLIADKRNFTQHSLLSLPAAGEFTEPYQMAYPWYETIRLGCLIIGIGVIFPLPPRAAPLHLLARKLKAELEVILQRAAHQFVSKTLLWGVVLGGVAASGIDERAWFVSTLRDIAPLMGLSSWHQVKTTLDQILWLGSACDSAGRALWDDTELFSDI